MTSAHDALQDFLNKNDIIESEEDYMRWPLGTMLPPVTVVDFDETDFLPPTEPGPNRTAGHLSKAFVEEAILAESTQ